MSAAEAWPTEAAATAAVEAAAKKVYEINARPGDPQWEELSAFQQMTIKNSVLSLVCTALEALPDPRHAAWEMGYIAADNGKSEDTNPFPSGL